MTIVEAGARRDLGQLDAALRTLELAPLMSKSPGRLGGAAALRLRRHPRGGRPRHDALAWFHRTHAIDSDEITDAASAPTSWSAQQGLSRISAIHWRWRRRPIGHNGATNHIGVTRRSTHSESSQTRSLGKAHLDAGMKEGHRDHTHHHAATARPPGDTGRPVRALRAVRAVPAHRVGGRRRARRCRLARLDAAARPDRDLPHRVLLAGDAGSAAALASALRGWNHLRFEVTEEPTTAPRARATPTRPSSASSTPSPGCTATS